MNRSLVTATLCLTLMTPVFGAKNYVHTFVKLEHWALGFIDGKTPGMNGDACLDALQVRGLINKVLRGEPDRATRTFIKPYEFNGKKVALDDLVELEKANAIEPGTPLAEEYAKCLRAIKEEFLEFTAPLLGEAEVTREQTLLIVKEWCERTDRMQSMMLNWGKLDERVVLFASTAREFRRFCRDLKNFLHDLMFNCPKGRALFKQERLSMLVLKDVFGQLSDKPGAEFEKVFNELAVKKVEESEHNFPADQLKQYIDRKKKHKLAHGKLMDIVFEALELADSSVSADKFAELFYQRYETKCSQFDSSFTIK